MEEVKRNPVSVYRVNRYLAANNAKRRKFIKIILTTRTQSPRGYFDIHHRPHDDIHGQVVSVFIIM